MLKHQRHRVDADVDRAEAAVAGALWDGLATEWSCVAPRTYPDGSPYLSEQHLANLAWVAARVSSLGWHEGPAVVGHLTTLMVAVRDVDKRPGCPAHTRALLHACTILVSRGLVREAGFVAAAGVDVNRYHQQRTS
jgi:hypothetical protein